MEFAARTVIEILFLYFFYLLDCYTCHMLRYLWLPDYKNIQKQGFNFDSALDARYTANTGVLELIPSATAQLPNGFYGRNIELVTGVLGENGAGKSALVAAILETAGSFANGATRDAPPCLFIFGQTIVHQASIKLSNTRQLERAGYRVYRYEDSINYNELFLRNTPGYRQQRDAITQHCYIHYANFMDSPWTRQFGVVDVSTAYLLNDINLRNLTLREQKADSLVIYRTQDFKWEIMALHYLRAQLDNPLPFAPPRQLQVEALPVEQIFQAKLEEEFFSTLEINRIKGWVKQLEDQLNEADKLPVIEEFIVRFTLPRLLVLLRVYPDEFRKLRQQLLQRLLRVQGSAPRVSNEEFSGQLKALYDFAALVRATADANQVMPLPEPKRHGRVVTRTITIDITTIPLQKLLNIFTSLLVMPNNAQTFEATWSGLSSGQLAYLRLYARLYYARYQVQDRTNSARHDIKSLTILLDEAETAFHPQWQKNYLQLVLEVVTRLFKEYRLQLIVCSNSPFIASDIPQSNLLLLHRQLTGTCEVKPWGGREKTFAANIHTLLTESFFMADGLMGDFARQKVGRLIQYLQDDQASLEQQAEMRQLLDLIGEPVVRLKLREMWAAKFGAAERITELERQLAELRRQQENG
jgi:predicted ATPase